MNELKTKRGIPHTLRRKAISSRKFDENKLLIMVNLLSSLASLRSALADVDCTLVRNAH